MRLTNCNLTPDRDRSPIGPYETRCKRYRDATSPTGDPGVVRWLLLALLRLYKRFLSPLLGQRCRFYPSCSTYAAEAISQHGAARGSYMAVCRVARCHPGCEGGHDPVPLVFSWRPWRREER